MFDYASKNLNPGPEYPVLTQTKKVVPGFSVGSAKQNALWDDEYKKAYVTPGPLSYEHDDKIMKPRRYSGNKAMGYDVKCN